MRRKGTENRDLPCLLSSIELAERADRFAWLLARQEELGVSHEAKKAQMKKEVGELSGEIGALAKVLRDRAEPRTVVVAVLLDDALKRVYKVRTDTGEVIRCRDMYESEKQLKIAEEEVATRFIDAVQRFNEKRAQDEAGRTEDPEQESNGDSEDEAVGDGDDEEPDEPEVDDDEGESELEPGGQAGAPLESAEGDEDGL